MPIERQGRGREERRRHVPQFVRLAVPVITAALGMASAFIYRIPELQEIARSLWTYAAIILAALTVAFAYFLKRD